MSPDSTIAFTVFTPTYNRGSTLHRVWESLCAQTFRSFEWLIIDDGSTDNTRELVNDFQKNAPFPVRYFWQPNQHKKVAFNHAVREAQGQLLLGFDSDDGCQPNSLERLWWHWQNIPAEARDSFSAVTVLCYNQFGNIVGDRFPGGDWIDSTSVEMAHRYRVRGEKWGFHRLDVLRQFPFPDDVKGYVPESYVWVQIDQRYKTRYVNEALRLYYQNQADSQMTAAKGHPGRDAEGNSVGIAKELAASAHLVLHDPVAIGKLAANLTRVLLHSTLSWSRIWRIAWTEQTWLSRLLILVGSPVGVAYYLKDQLTK